MSDLQIQTGYAAIAPERALVERIAWFVRLRWLAGAAILVGAAVSRWGLGIPVGSSAFIVGLVVLLYNGAFHFGAQRIRSSGRAALAALVNLQIVLDLTALTCLMHLSGGIASPLRWFFVFHAVISSTLLRRRDACLQAALAVGLVAGLTLLERGGWLTPPPGLPWRGENQQSIWEVGFFAATQFVAVFLVASIASALRVKEERLSLVQRDLSEAYRQLEELDNARSQYLITHTHELRSPVAAIQSLLKVMPFAGELPEKAKDLLERADRRVTALLRLVNDLLDVAKERHEFGTAKFRTVDLGEVLRSVRAACQGRADEKQIMLEIEGLDVGARVFGDPEELERLFGNLVDNAVNYTPSGGTVTVTARRKTAEEQGSGGAEGQRSRGAEEKSSRGAEEQGSGGAVSPAPLPPRPPAGCRDGAWVEVAVKDTGIGIPRESFRRLFEEFYRAPNAKKMVAHGTGLGLTICRRIVEEHRGRIDVESEENVGSTFTVRIPLASGPGTAS